MSDLKDAILDAKYIDMISLGDFVVRDCGLPDVDADGNLMPQANEIAAALFRWAADMQAEGPTATAAPATPVAEPEPEDEPEPEVAPAVAAGSEDDSEYDEFGDPVMDAEDAAERDEARQAEGEETP